MELGRISDVTAALLPQSGPTPQWRQVTIVSVEAGGTCTINLAGTAVSGVPYDRPPMPGGSAWALVQGGQISVTSLFQVGAAHCAVALGGSNQSIPDGTGGAAYTVTSFTAEADPWSIASNGVITIPADGWWHIEGWLNWPSSSTGARWVFLAGSVNIYNVVSAIASSQLASWVSTGVWFTKGDTVYLRARQNTGGPVSLTSARLTATWIGHHYS